MKNIILACLFLVSANVFAGSGSAVVSHWMATGSTVTSLWVSNITSHDLEVEITFYDTSGTALSPSSFFDFQNSNTEIGAGKSGYVSISSDSYGYAVIKWNNKGTDDDAFGLVAYAHRSDNTASGWRAAIPINNGKPF